MSFTQSNSNHDGRQARATVTAPKPRGKPANTGLLNALTRPRTRKPNARRIAVVSNRLPTLGELPFYYFTPAGIDAQASIAYSDIAEKQNAGIDYLYNEAYNNWILNGSVGPAPVKSPYHETDETKLFEHLQEFRAGDIALPSTGAGYLSTTGYVSASPWQQTGGGGALAPVQLTSYSPEASKSIYGDYVQVAMPQQVATPYNSDIVWGLATEPLKTSTPAPAGYVPPPTAPLATQLAPQTTSAPAPSLPAYTAPPPVTYIATDPHLSQPVYVPYTPTTPTPGNIVGGPASPLTQQLKTPTSSVLPPALAQAAPSWFTEMPLWQTGLLTAGVAYAIYKSQSNQGRRSR